MIDTLRTAIQVVVLLIALALLLLALKELAPVVVRRYRRRT